MAAMPLKWNSTCVEYIEKMVARPYVYTDISQVPNKLRGPNKRGIGKNSEV